MAPLSTPRSLKILMLTLVAGTVLSPFFFPYLALSLQGISRLYLWQFATSMFTSLPKITFSSLFHLAFNLFLLWSFGASLLEKVRAPLFYTLYLSSGIVGALFAFAAMHLFALPHIFIDTTLPIFALLIAWVFHNPSAELLLFFAIPVKARFLVLGMIGAVLLLYATNTDWVPFFALLGASLYTYFFTLIAWRIRSPFPLLAPFERSLFRLLEKKRGARAKVYDIKSGREVMKDDAFMDAMLAKISREGEGALSPEEKKRMQEISRRKHGS